VKLEGEVSFKEFIAF
jgi:Ca2+-binding EF-hand superfamily protein